MAMNKKEQALMEDLKVRAAFHWTAKVEPDLMPPTPGGDINDLIKGYSVNSHSMRVSKACSSSIYHNQWDDTKTTSQGSMALFSTKKLALEAMRHEVAYKAAKDLRAVDKMIEECD